MGNCLGSTPDSRGAGQHRSSTIRQKMLGLYHDDADTLIGIYNAMDDDFIRNQPLMTIIEEMVYHCCKLFPKYFLEFRYCTELNKARKSKHLRKKHTTTTPTSNNNTNPNKTDDNDLRTATTTNEITVTFPEDDDSFIRVRIQGATLGLLILRKSIQPIN